MMKYLSDKRLSSIILSSSLLLWSISILTSRLQMGDFGLIDSLNWTYFAAVFALVLGIGIQIYFVSSKRLIVLMFFALTIMLFVTPLLVEGTPRFTFSYLTYGYTDDILVHAHTSPSILTYQDWPGAMLLGAGTTLVSGLGELGFLAIYPILVKFISLLIVYLIVKSITGEVRLALLGLLVYEIGDWTALQYFTPPSLGGTLFFLAILLVFWAVTAKRNEAGWKVLLIIVFTALVMTHMLSTLAFLVTLVLLAIIFWLSHMKLVKLQSKENTGYFKTGMLVLLVVIFLSYTFFVIGEFVNGNLNQFLNNLLNAFGVVTSTENSLALGLSSPHAILMRYKILFILAFVALAGFSLAVILLRRKGGLPVSRCKLPLTVIASNIIAVPMVVGPYSGEIMSRAFAYSTPFLAILIAFLGLRHKLKLLVVVFLVIAPFLFVVSAYGNESIDYVSPGEIEGNSYLHSTITTSIKICGVTPRIFMSSNIEQIRWTSMSWNVINDLQNGSSDSTWYIYDLRSVEAYQFTEGKSPPGSLACLMSAGRINAIYATSGIELFRTWS